MALFSNFLDLTIPTATAIGFRFVRRMEYLVSNLHDEIAQFAEDAARAWARQDLLDELREAVWPRAALPPLGNHAIRPRYARLPRSGLPARFAFYQGSF